VRLAAWSFLACLFVPMGPKTARADDLKMDGYVEDLGPVLPPPPGTLPHFWHDRTDLTLDWLMSSASIRGAGNESIGLLEPSAEVPIGELHREYVFARLPLAAAVTDRAGTKMVAGNLELGGRLVFPMPSWLAFAASMGFVLPTARFDRGSPAQEAAVAAVTMEPTEISLLTPNAFGVRPAFDVRLIRGPFVLQVRDGVDLAMDTARKWALTAAGRIIAHAGFVVLPKLELSVEAAQIYFFTNGDVSGIDATDAKRTALTIGPFVRYSMGDVDLGVGATTNIQSPLATPIDQFVAARVSLALHTF
jgi:hypothetical protein